MNALTRTILVLVLISCSLNANDYHIIYDGHAASVSDGETHRLMNGDSWRGDVTVHGDEIVIMNGALDNYVGTISGNLVIADLDGEVLHSSDVTVHDGCGYVWKETTLRWSPPSESAQLWLDWYYSRGPSNPDLDLAREWTWGGPNPDPLDAGAAGSGRVAWSRWPLGIAVMHLRAAGDDGSADQYEEMFRWACKAPWDRAQNYYRMSDNVFRPFTALEDRDTVIGWGYRARGGPSDTWGATNLHGRPGKSPGKFWVDRQHADMAGQVFVAAATGSWAALQSSRNMVEALASHNLASNHDWPNSRAAGWPLRSTVLLARLVPDRTLIQYIDMIGDAVTETRGSNGDFFWIVQDTKAQDHLGGIPSESSFMCSIFGESAGMAAELMESLGSESHALVWRSHQKWAMLSVFWSARQPRQNEDTGEVEVPLYVANDWGEDVFKPVNEDWPLGLGLNTVLPFSASLHETHQAPLVIGDWVAKRAFQKKWWGGKSPARFMLDSGHLWAGAHGGWPGKVWPPVEPIKQTNVSK